MACARKNLWNRRGGTSRRCQPRSNSLLRACWRAAESTADRGRLSVLFRRNPDAASVCEERYPVRLHVKATRRVPEGSRQRPTALSIGPRCGSASARRDGCPTDVSTGSADCDGGDSCCVGRPTRAYTSRGARASPDDAPERSAREASSSPAQRTGPRDHGPKEIIAFPSSTISRQSANVIVVCMHEDSGYRIPNTGSHDTP
jgi:hypothetical protein